MAHQIDGTKKSVPPQFAQKVSERIGGASSLLEPSKLKVIFYETGGEKAHGKVRLPSETRSPSPRALHDWRVPCLCWRFRLCMVLAAAFLAEGRRCAGTTGAFQS